MKLLVLDGNSILNRAFYGIKLLSTKEGLFTNGIYGFMTMMEKVKEETQPDGIAVAFDLRAPTFRHKAYAGYKAQRKGMPEELAQQLPLLKELLRDLGYRIVEAEGFEADDILGTLAARCGQTGDDCLIATGDRDSLQLVDDHVTVRIAATKMGRPEVTIYDKEKILETYGVTPKQLIDVKALQGDSSDNIPGVPGIGQKGALDLIQRFGSLDAIYQDLDTLDVKEGMRKKLREGKDSAYLSRMLGTISTEAPVPLDLDEYRPGEGDREAAARLMARLEFFSLIDKLGLRDAAHGQAEAAPQEEWEISTAQGAAPLAGQAEQAGRCYLLLGPEHSLAVAGNGKIAVLKQEDATLFLQNIGANGRVRKITHDSKILFAELLRQGTEPDGSYFDTMLAAYLLNPSASGYGLERLAEEYAAPIPQAEGEQGWAMAAGALPALAESLERKIGQNSQDELLQKIEMPLAEVLADMELAGFEVDAQGVAQYGTLLQLKIDLLQSQIYQQAGYEFNLNSPKQLGEALFGKMGIPAGKKTKSGYSTSAEVLEGLKFAYPVVADILEYRTLAKLKSTYCDGLLKVVGEDGRIHSKFNQTETRTGRISSTEPNLQNIPVRTDVGRELRRFFQSRKGWTLVDADYSQIELRVLAHVANDQTMIEAFRNNEDIHRITAAQVFGMPPQLITPLLRSRAKAVNFGIVYGIGAFSLSKDIGVTRSEADRYIKGYLAHYTGVREYMERVVEQAKEKGYVETMFGRRRYLPELTSSNHNLRAFGERVARNMPIQGTAADIIKIAMVRVFHRLKEEQMQAKLILQVHDELIVEAPENEAVRASEILREEMEQAVALSVPLTVDCHMGKTWYDAKGD